VTRALTLAAYAVVAGAMAAWELVARRRGRATLVDTVAVVSGHRVGKWIALAVWLWVGWHLFVRASGH
jgi:hypothetical protein